MIQILIWARDHEEKSLSNLDKDGIRFFILKKGNVFFENDFVQEFWLI